MKRREFISGSCTACLSLASLTTLITGCMSSKYIPGTLNKDGLIINTDDFKLLRNGKIIYHPYIIVRNEALLFPICIYRFSNEDYTALWMQCAHQGAEVQVAGTHLQCPAHGSEYDNRGRVTNGPATAGLRTFPLTISNAELFIDLRKQS